VEIGDEFPAKEVDELAVHLGRSVESWSPVVLVM
jgi:hypothetical protein